MKKVNKGIQIFKKSNGPVFTVLLHSNKLINVTSISYTAGVTSLLTYTLTMN